MSKISTTISLEDNVSRVLNRINKNLDKAIGSFNGLDESAKSFINTAEGLKDVNVGDISSQLDKSTSAVKRFGNSFNNASGKATSAFGQIIAGAKRIAAVYLSIETIKAIVSVTDDLQNSQNRLSVITGNTSNAIKAQQAILNSANDSYSDYGDTVDQVAKLMMNAPNQFKTVGDATKFTNTFQKLGKLGGASVYESSQAMYQLTQSMAKGKLGGDELRSVLEGMPLVANAIAKHFNTDIGTMKQMAAQGKVTADEVKAVLSKRLL